MLNKLEEFKKIGMYCVNLYYGESSVGCDDLGVPQEERNIILLGSPVGCVGETRVLLKTNVKNFISFDFKTKPKKIHNPPSEGDYRENGFYIWGTDDGVKRILERNWK
jgi:hypothetical protein